MVIAALRDAVGPLGTILGYADWQADDEALADATLRDDVPPFDPLTSRATRDNGFFPEALRTTPGALRSANPGASMVALGGRAAWFVADHALDYGYGPRSPLGKLVEVRGKVLMLGAPLDTMTLLHHAEHLADLPGKKIKRYEAPVPVDGKTVWRRFEEFNTSHPIVDGLDEDYFATVVEDFLATGRGKRGTIGAAPSVLINAGEIVPFAVAWLERRFKPAS
jgi:aminoglycoside 3-N-acetyltransferase